MLFKRFDIKKIKMFFVSFLVAFIILLNFYMLNKVISNPGNARNIDQTININH